MTEEDVDKLHKIYSVLTDEEVEAWLASSDDLKLPGAGVTAAFRDAEVEFLQFSASGGCGADDSNVEDQNYDDIAISRLSELFSELLWRVVGGTLGVDIAVDYLASDQPFQKRLGGEGGDGDEVSPRNPLMELLCDTLWGMDAMAVMEGSPAHPSYPAGHAVQNGAFATVLKALVGIERADTCFEEAFYPNDDGTELLKYEGDCLTYEGEINKMAVNIAFGRQMCGVHYRMDSEEGLLLGEIVGVRMLQQEVVGFPENAPYEFRLMSGQAIKLDADGSCYVDDKKCKGDGFMGAHAC